MAKRKTKKVEFKTKMEHATAVYTDMVGRGLPRKAIIEAFMADVKLTKAGASTYYQTISKKT